MSMLSFLPLPHQWGSSSRLHDKCHTHARHETYNGLSLGEVTDLSRKPEIATLSSKHQQDIKDHAVCPHSSRQSLCS